jgi:ATP-binding cassette subfamily B protein
MKETERIEAPRGPGHGMMAGQVGQKALDFGPSLRRLASHLKPQRVKVTFVFISAIASVALTALGPRVLGRATDIVFAGAIGGQMPTGISREQAIEGARASGQSQIADLLSGVDFTPGMGIDFNALASVLLVVVTLYAGSALLSYLQGWLLNDVVQNTIYRLRSSVEDKLNRLPLSYFDRQPRGELLSRVTNDIDNVSQSLQQTMSQMLTSILTIVFVVSMMFIISPTLALVALVTIPVTMVVAGLIMRRSQSQFIAQWRHTGALNGQIEEAFTGHALV